MPAGLGTYERCWLTRRRLNWASSLTLPEAVDTALKAIERRSSKPSSYDGAPPPVLPSVSSEDLGQADERAV